MSKFYYTSNDLLASIKRRVMVPENQSTFTEQDFLDFATEEMNIGLVPLVLQMSEDYYLYPVDIPLVSGTTKYPIPYRAIGNKLRDVNLVDSNGKVSPMTRIGIGDVSQYNGSTSNVYPFYMANNEICLVVDANTTFPTGSVLQASIYLRPNALVPNSEVAVITAIDRTTGIVQLSNFPTDFAETELLDFIRSQSPHKILDYDVQCLSMDSVSKTVTFAVADIPAELSINDRIALATETDIPQLPSDLHVVLAHRVATKLLESLGDTEGLENANKKLNEMQSAAAILINNRVEDAPKKVVNYNSPIRNGLSRGRYKRW